MYVVDGTFKYFDASFCVMEYIQGTPLNVFYDQADERERNRILYRIGDMAAQINQLVIEDNRPYVANRNAWPIISRTGSLNVYRRLKRPALWGKGSALQSPKICGA